MVCKEEVCLWFKKNEPHRRLELLCCLLNLCLPFELHFIKTCLEDLNKRVDLKDVEAKSNSHQEIKSLCNDTLNEHIRSKLVICLAFLGASNRTGSDVIYRFLVTSTPSTNYQDTNYLKDMLLLYTMVLNHPAFTFQQKNSVGNLFESLTKLANENDGTPSGLQGEGEQVNLKLHPSSDDESGLLRPLQNAAAAAVAPELSGAVDGVQPSEPRPAGCPPLARVPAHLPYFEGMPREYVEHLSQLTGALPYLPHPLHAVPGQQQSSQHPAAGAAVPPDAPASLNTYSPSHHFPSLVLDYAAVAAANTYYAPTALHPPQYALTDAVTSPPPPAPSIPAEDAPPKAGATFVGSEVHPPNHLQPVGPHQLLGAGPVYREYVDPGAAPLAQEPPLAIVALSHQPDNVDHNARRKNPESEEEFMYGDDVSVSTTYIYNSNIVAPALSLSHPASMSLAGFVGSNNNAEGSCLLPCPADGGEPDGGFAGRSGISCAHQHTSSAHSSAQSSSPYASPPQSLPTSRCVSPSPEQLHEEPGPQSGTEEGSSSRACLSPQDSELIANNLACFAFQQSQNMSPRSNDPQESSGGPHYVNNDSAMNECSSFRSQSSIMPPYPVKPGLHVAQCGSSNTGPLCANGNSVVPYASLSSNSATPECRRGVEAATSPSKQTETNEGPHPQKERDASKRHVPSASVNLTSAVTATVTTVLAHSSSLAQFSPSRKHAYRGRQAADASESRNDRQLSVASPSKQDKIHSQSKPRTNFDSSSSIGSDVKRPEGSRTSVESISFDVAGSACSSQLYFMSHGDFPHSGSAAKCMSAQYPCGCHQPVSGQTDDTSCEGRTSTAAGSSGSFDQQSSSNSAHDNINSKSARSQRRPSCDGRVAQSPQRHQGRAAQHTQASNAGQAGASPSKPTSAPPHPRPVLDCTAEDHVYQSPPAAAAQVGVVNCVEPSRLGHPPGASRNDRNTGPNFSCQPEDPVVLPATSLHAGHATIVPQPAAPPPPASHSIPASTSHAAGLVSYPTTSQMSHTSSGVTISPVSSSSVHVTRPPLSMSGSPSHTSSASHSSLVPLPATLSSDSVRSSIASSSLLSSVCFSGAMSSCSTPSSSVTLVTSVPLNSSNSGCISFGDVNLSSLDLPGPEVVELSNGTEYLLAKPHFESQNRSSLDCTSKQSVNFADKSRSSSNSDAKYSCQKPDNRESDPYRPLRILTNNNRGKPVSSRNNNSSSSNGSNNHNNSHNNNSHNGKYRGAVPNSYDDGGPASSFRSISGLNARNAKRGMDCANGGMVHMLSNPLRHLGEVAPSNEALRGSAPSALHNGDVGDQRPALLPCPGLVGNSPLTNGFIPSSSSAPEMPAPHPDDPPSSYVGRPCILPAPQHVLSRAPHFGPNFLSTPPPSLPFQPGVGLLPAPPPPPSKVPPMVMSSSPPPLTTSPSKTSTATTASTSIVTSAAVSGHQRTSPPQPRTSPPHPRHSPPRGLHRSSDQHFLPTGASLPNGHSNNSSSNNNNKNNLGPHGCNNGPPPAGPYGGSPYLQQYPPHVGGPQPYFMGGSRPPPHSVFPPHKLPPPPYHGPPRQGGGGMGGGNSSSSSTCSSHSSHSQHKSRHSNRKSGHHNGGRGGGGGHWGHQSGERRGQVPPTGGSTDTSPDSSQYSSPPQTPSPDQENKPAGKRNEEEPWDRSNFPMGKGGSYGGGSGGDSTPPLPQVPLLFPPPHGNSVRPRYFHYPFLQYHPSPPMWRYSLSNSRFPASHLQQQQPTQPSHGEKGSRETTPALVHLPPPNGEGHAEGTGGPSVSPPGLANGVAGPLGGAAYGGPPSNYPVLVNATMMALHSLMPAHPHHAPPPPPNPAHSLSNGFPAPHPQPSLPPNFPSLPNMSSSSLHPELFFASYGHSPQHSPYLPPPLLPHISAQAPLMASLPPAAGGGGGPAFPAAASKKPSSCYNCGQLGHRGTECREASIEDMTKRTKVS